MTKEELKSRLELFAKTYANELDIPKDLRKLAEASVWVGACWLAAKCGIEGICANENKEKEE